MYPKFSPLNELIKSDRSFPKRILARTNAAPWQSDAHGVLSDPDVSINMDRREDGQIRETSRSLYEWHSPYREPRCLSLFLIR